MKSYDYNAVCYEGTAYCTECLPEGVDEESEEVSPIFADQEWDYYPVCDHCGAVHDYVSLTAYGQRQEWLHALPNDLQRIAEANNETLPSFAWPGGYPLFYLDKDDSVLCPDCANHTDARPIVHGIHWEGEPLSCDNCDAEIESAYGIPEGQS